MSTSGEKASGKPTEVVHWPAGSSGSAATRHWAGSCSFSLPEKGLEAGPLVRPQGEAGGQEDQEQDHDDRVDDPAVLLHAR